MSLVVQKQSLVTGSADTHTHTHTLTDYSNLTLHPCTANLINNTVRANHHYFHLTLETWHYFHFKTRLIAKCLSTRQIYRTTKSHLSLYICVCVCGLVTLRNAIISLLEPGTTGIQKHDQLCLQQEYLLDVSNEVNLKKEKNRYF